MARPLTPMSRHVIGARCREWFLPPLAPTSGFPPVELAGVSELRPPYRMARPAPGFRLVLATWGGRGALLDGDTQQSLLPGNVLIAEPLVAHDYAIAGSHWNIVWFHLNQNQRWTGLHGPTRVLTGWRWCEQLARAMRGACAAADEPRQAPAWTALLRHLLTDLGAPTSEDRLAPLWRLVQERLHRTWSVADLAAAAGLSPAQLTRICRAHHGHPPAGLVTRLRLDRAQQLRQSGATLEAIAAQVGFSDGFALSKAWKRRFGQAPAVNLTI